MFDNNFSKLLFITEVASAFICLYWQTLVVGNLMLLVAQGIRATGFKHATVNFALHFKWSAISGLSFFARCWWSRESVLQGSSALSEFRTSLSKVLTLWYCVKLKQRYHGIYFVSTFDFYRLVVTLFRSLFLQKGGVFVGLFSHITSLGK